MHAADAEVGHRLIHDLFGLAGRDAAVQRSGEDFAILIDSLAAKQGGKPAQIARAIVESHFLDNLVEREVLEPFGELGVGIQEHRFRSGTHLLAKRLRVVCQPCFIRHDTILSLIL